jgi:hypothetical protein
MMYLICGGNESAEAERVETVGESEDTPTV